MRIMSILMLTRQPSQLVVVAVVVLERAPVHLVDQQQARHQLDAS